jgi:hypothetical protein
MMLSENRHPAGRQGVLPCVTSDAYFTHSNFVDGRKRLVGSELCGGRGGTVARQDVVEASLLVLHGPTLVLGLQHEQ